MGREKSELIKGTLDMMVLQVLSTIGPMHGWGIARRIEQVSENLLSLNQGTLYPALVRLEQRRLVVSAWGVSSNNRRARFYTITKKGEKQVKVEQEQWERMQGIISRLLQVTE
jgi:PadR family transcriptional regulator, regulatory protein PadR